MSVSSIGQSEFLITEFWTWQPFKTLKNLCKVLLPQKWTVLSSCYDFWSNSFFRFFKLGGIGKGNLFAGDESIIGLLRNNNNFPHRLPYPSLKEKHLSISPIQETVIYMQNKNWWCSGLIVKNIYYNVLKLFFHYWFPGLWF